MARFATLCAAYRSINFANPVTPTAGLVFTPFGLIERRDDLSLVDTDHREEIHRVVNFDTVTNRVERTLFVMSASAPGPRRRRANRLKFVGLVNAPHTAHLQRDHI
ncbi:MAG: hypothetical protein PVI23_07065 [Maricaulaceae bacterium]